MKNNIQFTTVAIILAIIIVISCRKQDNEHSGTHLLKVEYSKKIKINQVLHIFDTTSLYDSAHYYHPPQDRIYEWKIIPENHCVSISRFDPEHGKADFTFHCSGSYKISAHIYSPEHQLVASTNTVEIQVTSDTLYPKYAIKADDTLLVSASVLWRSDLDTNIARVNFNFKTATSYAYGGAWRFGGYSLHFDYMPMSLYNNCSFTFKDSLRIPAYPFIYSNEYEPMGEANDFTSASLRFGVAANINVTWLGKTYSGTFTPLSIGHHTYTWDNSGAVRFR